MTKPPKIDNAPGLTWKPRKAGWEARWQARTDLVERGYRPRSLGVWTGLDPSEIEKAYIADKCNSLQASMLIWGRGGIPVAAPYDYTLGSLIDCYTTDKDSPYRKLRIGTRRHYGSLCKPLRRDFGTKQISEIRARDVLHWHESFLAAGTISMGHSVIGMLRILAGFGATILEDKECERLSGMLSNMRFTMAKPRNSVLVADQVIAVRAQLHAMERPSIALAQAFQFELMFRQKDVIGEWVPMTEPGISDTMDGNNKWLRGIRWEEINADMVLTHITSKRQKEITVDLKNAPMVMEELQTQFGTTERAKLPASGPIIVSDISDIPWYAVEFRRNWRLAANACGIPKSVKNMDSRAGAITEATDAGADLEHVRHAATHSDIGMTQRYSRRSEEKTAGVMILRAASRQNKT